MGICKNRVYQLYLPSIPLHLHSSYAHKSGPQCPPLIFPEPTILSTSRLPHNLNHPFAPTLSATRATELDSLFPTEFIFTSFGHLHLHFENQCRPRNRLEGHLHSIRARIRSKARKRASQVVKAVRRNRSGHRP